MGESKKSKVESQKVEDPATENGFLNPALEGKFRIKGTHCQYVLNTALGDIDFRTLTEEQAEQLVADGFPDGFVFLEKVFS